MKCIILCAGYATRLYPLTLNKSKSLLLIAGKPILNYIIEKVEALKNVDEIFIVTNDRFYKDFLDWSSSQNFKIKILNDKTINNDEKLGAVGDLEFAVEKGKISDDVLLILGDNLFDINLNDMLNFFKKIKSSVIGLSKVRDLNEAKRFGVVELEEDKIISFEEKPEFPKSNLVSTGIYFYPKSVLEKIQEYIKSGKPKDNLGSFVKELIRTHDVYGFLLKGSWYDIGTKEIYERLNESGKMTIVLGIESTAHTFGVGVVRNGKILSNVKCSYITERGGIIPMDAAKHHEENKERVYFEALNRAGIKEEDLDAVSFSQGPGLAPCLLVGMKFAKELSKRLSNCDFVQIPSRPPTGASHLQKIVLQNRLTPRKNVPLVPANHCIAHLEISKLTDAKDPVMLYVSGANTQIIAYASGKYRVFGETLDVGVGNFIDTFGRYAGLGFPAGPKIEELSKKGKNYVELPYKVKGMDITLSGILTNLKQKLESKKYDLCNLAYSMQETVFAMLVETAERALAHTGKNELVLGGGVGCNSRLQEMCRIMCKERGAKFFCPDNSLLVDNGAMIAFLGEIMFKSKTKIPAEQFIDIKPRQRTDDVLVNWK